MRSFLALALALALLPLAVQAQASREPWSDGETLDYLVRWGAVPAAEAKFAAHRDGAVPGGWRFTLDLGTRGPAEAIHPIRSKVYSVVRNNPWRSVAYGEDRLSGDKRQAESGKIDYAAGQGLWHEEKGGQAKDTPFPVPAAIDDVGSMLYRLRLAAWKDGAAQPLGIYDGPKVEKAEARLLRREPLAPASGGPAVSCLVVLVRPVYDDPKKDAKGYGVTLWITDDARRLPLRADLKARFGTFTLDWVNPASPPTDTPKG